MWTNSTRALRLPSLHHMYEEYERVRKEAEWEKRLEGLSLPGFSPHLIGMIQRIRDVLKIDNSQVLEALGLVTEGEKEMKLEHGDRISCEIRGIEVPVARVSVAKNGTYLCQNAYRGGGEPGMDTFGFTFSCLYEEGTDITGIKKLPGLNVNVGDVIIRLGLKRKVLEVFPNTCALSQPLEENLYNVFTVDKDGMSTYEELAHQDHKIVKPEEPKPEKTEYTVAELIEKAGLDGDSITIKEGA